MVLINEVNAQFLRNNLKFNHLPQEDKKSEIPLINAEHKRTYEYKEDRKDVKYKCVRNPNMTNTTFWSKLKVVLWKNFVIRKHHWFLTLCEITIPIVLFVLIAYARAKIGGLGKEYVTTPTYNPEYTSFQIYNDKFYSETQVYFTPTTEFTKSLIYEVQLKLTLHTKAVRGFESESDLITFVQTFGRNETVMAVVFDGISSSEIPKNLKYTIRPFDKYFNWNLDSLFYNRHTYVPESGSEDYINKGFIALQMALDSSFIEMTTNKSLPVILNMQEFPYPPYLNDVGITDVFLHVLPLVTVFSFVFLCPAVLKRIVEEKSTGIKELMKMMGLRSWMLWLGWFLHAFLINFVSICVITFFMKATLWDAKFPPIEYCSWSLFLVFLLLYCASGITFCFAISSFFSRPTLAMVMGILFWILSYVIPNNLAEGITSVRWHHKLLLGMFPNMALGFGYKAISTYETREVGANWHNLFQSADGSSKDISMGNVLVMFVCQIIVYMLITLYIESIQPGPYGLAKQPHFPISYVWNKIRRTSKVINDEEETISKDYCKIEKAPDLAVGIQIKNLRKNFGKHSAVNGLSMDIYKGQITALLGHNGAGKTTTMSIITGMIGATSGRVLINDEDIRCNMNNVRSSLGLCPQHNLQFTDLTVFEHLIFFGMLKGLSKSQAEEQAQDWLSRMNLSQKKHNLASSLSGGMRRKLSLAIALIGDPKVLILDEPTSGLDPEARREIWDTLLTMRGSRTIIITTHFMEEADVLGDRIAIMDHGQLICYGTSMFLKTNYGAGYHLTIIRDEALFQQRRGSKRNQVDDIKNLVEDNIKTAVLKADTGHHLTFLLPHEEKPHFSELLANLENEKENLCITNINMSVTTLEEVFLRVGNMVAKEKFGHSISVNSNGTVRSTNSTCSTNSTKSTGNEKVKIQLQTLLEKRVHVTKMKIVVFLVQVCLALILTFITLYVGKPMTSRTDEDVVKFNFDLSVYGESKVFYGGPGYDSELTKMQQHYDKLISSQLGNPQKVSDVSDAIIKEGIENIEFYRRHIIVAAEFNSTNKNKVVNAMYSNTPVHGAPISLNLLMNAILKGIMGDGYSISSANIPLPVAVENMSGRASEIDVVTSWFISFPLGMLFLTGTFLLFPQMERASNIKQLQLMCGVRSVFYWGMCYINDLCLYFVAVFLIIIEIVICGPIISDMFSGGKEIGALLAILSAYGISIIPYSYLFSYKKTAAGGFALFLISGLFVSIIMSLVVLILQMSGDDYYEQLGKVLKHIFLLFPQFGLTYTVVQFSRKAVWNYNWYILSPEHKRATCHFDRNPCCGGDNTPQCLKFQSYFCGEDGIGTNTIEMAASAIIYITLLLFLETHFVQRCKDQLLVFIYNKIYPDKYKMDTTDSVNPDVKYETLRVCDTLKREQKSQGKGDGDDLLLVHDLEKTYWGQKAVKGISFGVKAGDCFGLLGVNGAGKTTTFRMLTGDESPTSGNARILMPSKHTVSISDKSKDYLEKVGYCPQFDAINEVLTGREMLELFAKLRGVSSGVEDEVNMWLKALGLEEYADRLCGTYSGGNKRKLSMAVALIGNPMLVMLDEPTSGVDPLSRRKLWDTLTAIQNQTFKPSILLTSHSMEECEALCNKLAIMKAGQLECYGTIPQLKEKYGQGFTILLKLIPKLYEVVITDPGIIEDDDSTASQSQPLSAGHKKDKTNKRKCEEVQKDDEDSEEVKKLMAEFEEKYRGHCTLRDKHSGLLHYHINDKTKKWSNLFKEIEELKLRHSVIEDYNISETTLEEVFLSIARSGINKK